ncbi:uncharacterized protein EAF02_004058 [Botrytis sinoallii]|uniref:uncharacterized protein n=1 Tax=Botrytis sinoallii TaxID=1463999 RepID=UPI0019014844|nr:uncharacterized protein EAF02_004058 [Botrytis sinoallii]KAF7885549.1 hypothetical protein EAF02_004058 [Botrytis sinoallii]
MSSADTPFSNSSIKKDSSPMLSDLKQEILELPVDPRNRSNGLKTKNSASYQKTGIKVNNPSPEYSPQSDEKTVPGLQFRDLQRMEGLHDFIASALAQFSVDEFIKRFHVTNRTLQRFFTHKTQIDADQGEEISNNIEVMKAEILESRKALSIRNEGGFVHSEVLTPPDRYPKAETDMARAQAPRLTAPTSWIAIQIPVNKHISDSKSEEGKKWLEIIKPLTKELQPDFEHGVWGRLIERPNEVWLITGWESLEAIRKFEESDVGLLEHVTDFTGITDVYFPEDVEDEAKKRVNDLKGLIYFFALGKKSGKSPYSGKAIKGWVSEPVEFEEKQTRVMRPKRPGNAGMEEVHCKFETIPWKFWNYTSEEEREMAKMDAEE